MIWLFALAGCKDDSAASAGPLWDDLSVQLDPFAIDFGNGQVASIQFGVAPGYDDGENYDPYNLFNDDLDAPYVEWAVAESAHWSDIGLVLELDDGEEACLSRDETDPEGAALSLAYQGPGVAAFIRLDLTSPTDEGLYGLGESFAAMNQRGQLRTMQIELNTEIESGYLEEHVPVPFVVGSTGWGLALETDRPTVFSLDPDGTGTVQAVSNAPGGLQLRLLHDDDPVAVVASWTRASGLPRLPPTWALGGLIWRDENIDGAEVLADAQAIRDNDLAFSLIWVDNPWQSSYNSMQPDEGQFPDWDAMVDQLHDQGFRWMAWSTPYIEDADPDHDAYESNGWLVDLPVEFNGFGSMVDLTNPEAMEAWQDRVAAAADRGLQGWKLDYGEDIQLGLGSGRLVTPFSDGSDERTMHHRYAEYYHTAYAEPYGGGERFLLGRGGAWGTQAITDCIWPGDLDNDFHRHLEDGHVGGLPAAIRAGVTLSTSGFPCFASDTGGYRHGIASHEALVRWTEYSALLPVMQVGNTVHSNYWLTDESDWNEDTLAAGVRYTQLHIRLFPYFQRLMVDASTVGTPPLVPPGLAGGPQLDDAFLVGPSLYVAPVEEDGATSRVVVFPDDGTWVHWWTGEAFRGTAEVEAPLGEGPLFLREGAIVPMLRESVRTLSPTDGSVDSWADDPGELVVRIVPGEGSFSVVDGPELTLSADELTVGELGIYSGVTVELWAPEARRVAVDGHEVGAQRSGPWLRATVDSGTVSWR